MKYLVLVVMLLCGGCAAMEGGGDAADKGFPSLVPLVSPETTAKLQDAKALWIDDDCLNPEWAVELLDGVLEESPDYVDAMIWRGKALTALRYHEDAFDDFTRAVKLLEDRESREARALRARAYAGRALVSLRFERAQGAERDLESAFLSNPEEPTIYLYRAALYFLQNKDDKACADLRRACELGICGAQDRAASGGLCR